MKRRWTREGEMTINELRATYANMKEDKDKDLGSSVLLRQTDRELSPAKAC